MRIYHGIKEFERIKYPVVTSGTFDGVHVGHQKILKRVSQMARSKGGETVLLTFWPHPKFVLNPGNPMKLLTTFQEKSDHLRTLGVDHLIRIPFTKEFSQITSEEFVKTILVERIGTRQLVIGYNHRFGKNREGSFKYLQENASKFGFEVVEISRKDVDHIAVSSTKIREHILNNQIHLANKLLGRPYEFSGKVVRGQQIGRKIGFPTANIEIGEQYKLLPSDGTYAVQVHVRGTRKHGMMNIGVKPTLGKQPRSIEVHIFNFEYEIYGAELKVEVIKQIRPEMKFKNLEELSNRLLLDSQEARTILTKDIN
ncbi:MAG: bifunctional riboflavin kinase/FAD synthetase [Bacteroidetes bacterium]|nr:MAG: bifunctional riboflavin kinase/FAD synthetase [Bacteroidota bacterium]